MNSNLNKDEQDKMTNRRQFLKGAGAAALGAGMISRVSLAGAI